MSTTAGSPETFYGEYREYLLTPKHRQQVVYGNIGNTHKYMEICKVTQSDVKGLLLRKILIFLQGTTQLLVINCSFVGR